MILTRALLRTLPYETVRRLLVRARRTPRPSAMTPGECARAISRAARILPLTPCLARGLAAESLLRREGRDATLRFGVDFDAGHRLRAHAWLESGGMIVTGAEESTRHTPLAPPPWP
jgi:hypothetical protein